MIIKRYIVDNMNEAMVKIRYELGSDAVIVSQRRIKQNGVFGFFKPKKIEVTAAVDEKVKKIRDQVHDKGDIHREFSEIKSMIQLMIAEKKSDSTKEEDIAKNEENPRIKFTQKLSENDVPIQIIESLCDKVKEKNNEKDLSYNIYQQELDSIISEIISTESENSGRIQVLIGPTGVGKTTTIAKLASSYALYKNKKVGLITIDTYRIGAVEQLKTYAEILGVQIGVILSSSDIPDIMKRMEDCDIILIDTTGRNSKNIMQISETRKYIEELKPDRVHLVISMTTKPKDIRTIIDNYRIVNYSSIILTKFDETDTFGSILTAAYYGKVPISYITNGQNVPDDIQNADNDKLTELVLEDTK